MSYSINDLVKKCNDLEHHVNDKEYKFVLIALNTFIEEHPHIKNIEVSEFKKISSAEVKRAIELIEDLYNKHATN